MNLTWNWPMIATAAAFHSSAILCTLFRLWYRWSMACMWWDDGAVVALLADAASLISIVLGQFMFDTSNHDVITIRQWIGTFAFSSITWAARPSILMFMVRVSQPGVTLKRVALCVGLAFGVMWIEVIAQRLETCASHSCGIMATAVATAPTDGLSWRHTLDCTPNHIPA
ncbi:hypothetical protein V8E55_007051 [Tylopilus felleus]